MMGETIEEPEITLKLPGPNEKGFLRRVSEVRAIMALGDGKAGTVFDMWPAFADYLITQGYVTVPDDADA